MGRSSVSSVVSGCIRHACDAEKVTLLPVRCTRVWLAHVVVRARLRRPERCSRRCYVGIRADVTFENARERTYHVNRACAQRPQDVTRQGGG